MRYTEAASPPRLELMAGMDEDTVDLVPNYSNSDDEPVVLPARFPNLLVNGSQGIAVGMATNIRRTTWRGDRRHHPLAGNPDSTPTTSWPS